MATDVIQFLEKTSEQVGFLGKKLERLHSKNGQLKLAKEFYKIADAMGALGKGLNNEKLERQMQAIGETFKKSSKLIENEVKNSSKKRIEINDKANKQIEVNETLAFKRRINKISSFTHQAIQFFKMQMLWYPTKALSFKVLAIPGDVIRSTSEYGDALLQVSSVARLLPNQMKDLDSEIQKTAANTKFSITELGEATKQLAQAGFQKDEIKSAIQPIALLATATASSIQSSTNLISTIVRAYKKSASEIGDITDTLAAAVTKSRLTVEKLNEAFNYVASASAQAGVSFEDTTALLGVLANSGMRMTTAATGLRMSFLKLLAPTEKAAKELHKFGLTPEDVNLTKHNIYDVLKTIQSLPIDSVIKIFSARSATAILALNNVGVEGIKSMREAMKAHGLASTMAKEQLLGLKQSWKNLLDVITSTEYKLGKTFGDELALNIRTIKSYFISIGDSLDKTNSGVKTFFTWIKRIAELYATFSIAKAFGGGLFATETVAGLSKVLGETGKLSKAWLILKAAVKGTSLAAVSATGEMAAAAGGIEGAMASSAVTITSLFNPWTIAIMAIIAGIGAIVKHYYTLRKNTEKVISDTAKYNVEIEKIKGNIYDIQTSGAHLDIIKKEDAAFAKEYLDDLKFKLLSQIELAKKSAETLGTHFDTTQYDELVAKITKLTIDKPGGFTKLAKDAQNFINTISNVQPINNYLNSLGKVITMHKHITPDHNSHNFSDYLAVDIPGLSEGTGGDYCNLEDGYAITAIKKAIAKHAHDVGATFKTAYDELDSTTQSKLTEIFRRDKKDISVFFSQSISEKTSKNEEAIKKARAAADKALGNFKQEIDKEGSDHAWSKTEINALVSSLDTTLKAYEEEVGKEDSRYKEIKKTRDKLIFSLIKAPDTVKLDKYATKAAAEIKAAQKKVLGGIVGPNTAIDAASTFGDLVDDKFFDQVTAIEDKIAEMKSKNADFDTSGLQRQVDAMYAAYYKAFDDIEGKGTQATEKMHKQFLKLTKDALEVAKANGDVDGTIQAITIKYTALRKTITDQITALTKQKEKEGDVNKEIDENIQLLQKQQKQLNIKEAFEKNEAKSTLRQKELESQEEIYKLLGKTTEARQVEIALYNEKINLINEDLSIKEKLPDSLKNQLNIEKEILEVKKEQLKRDNTESSAVDGFINQINQLGEEYKHIGITYNDGVKLANELNNKFASSIEDNFMALVDGTKSFTQAFKDSFKTILRDFYTMVMRMVAQKIVVPVVMNAVGGAVSGVASAVGMTGAATATGGAASSGLSWSGGGLQTIGDYYMSGMGGVQGAFASGLANMGWGVAPGTIVTEDLGYGITSVEMSSGTGAAGMVGSMSPQAFSGAFSGITTAIITGLKTGNWGYAAAKGVGVGGGAYAGGSFGLSISGGNPIAGVIGAVVGGLLGGLGIDSLFGHKQKPSWQYDVIAGLTYKDGEAIAKKVNWGEELYNPDDPRTFANKSLTNEELNIKYNNDGRYGDYNRSWGRKDKGKLNEMAISVSKLIDKGIQQILDIWGDWTKSLANQMPIEMASRFYKELSSTDATYAFRGYDKNPDEASVTDTIKALLKGVTDSLWNTYKDTVTSFSNEFYKYSFNKLGIKIEAPLVDISESFDEFQKNAQNVSDRLNALSALEISLGEIEGPTKFQQALSSVIDQFDTLEKTLTEKGATTAELTKLDELENVALGQMMGNLALSSNSMNDFSDAVDELAKYLKNAGTKTEEYIKILNSFEKTIGKSIKTIYESNHQTSGTDEAELYLAGFGYQYTPESWDAITGKLIDSWKSSMAYQVDQVDFGSWLVDQLQANGFDEGTALQIVTAWGKVGKSGMSAVDKINSGFSNLLTSFQSRISEVFDPLISIDQMIKDAGGPDYLFGDLTKKANTEEEMFQWAISTSNANAARQYGLALANTLKQLDPLSSNLDLEHELTWIRDEMNKLESPEDLQQSILSEARAYYSSSLSYLGGILTALNNFQTNQKLQVHIDIPELGDKVNVKVPDDKKSSSSVGNDDSFHHYSDSTTNTSAIDFFKSILPAGSFK